MFRNVCLVMVFFMATCSLLSLPLVQGVVAEEEEAETVQVPRGQQKTIKTGPIKRIALGDEKIASIRVLSSGEEILITGVALGVTDLFIWDKKGKKRAIKLVVIQSVAELAKEIEQLTEGIEGLRVKRVGSKVVLDGTLLTQADYRRVATIGSAYSGQVLNLTTLDRGPGSAVVAAAIKKAINLPGVKVSVMGDKIVLEGVVNQKADVTRAEKIAATYGGKVVNLVRMEEVMIETDVIFASVDLSKGKQVGSNILKGMGLNLSGGMTGGSGIAPTTTFSIASNAVLSFNALASKGAGTILSRPHLSTKSGETGSFHSGGEVFYEVSGSTEGSMTSIQYGLLLSVKPELRGKNEIVNTISIEVSAPVSTSGSQAFALSKFKTEDTVICKVGETVVISGLVDSIKNKFKEKTPVLGDIPILNLFFGSKKDTSTEKQLVLLVTPMLSTSAELGKAPASEDYEKVLETVEEEGKTDEEQAKEKRAARKEKRKELKEKKSRKKRRL